MFQNNPQFLRMYFMFWKLSEKTKTAVKLYMVYAYFEIGRMIVEEEQNGENWAKYGVYLTKELSVYWTAQFGKGFSAANLKQMLQFYMVYAHDEIDQTLSDQTETLPAVSTGRWFYQLVNEEYGLLLEFLLGEVV